MNIIKYPDGSSYAQIKGLSNPSHIVTINSYEDLWHLNQFVDACNSEKIRPTITIRSLIDAQADRRFNEGESSGLKLVCKFLNQMDADFKIFHPHNPEVVEALISGVEIIDNSEFIKKVIRDLAEINKSGTSAVSEKTILMSSDAGGFKPLMKLCDKIGWQGGTYSASKSRRINERQQSQLIQIVDREDFQGKDILIIDDICVYGGTFKGLSKLLRERNCGKLYLAVSHMTIQHLGDNPVTNYFDEVFTTNSKFDEYFIPDGHTSGISYVTPKNLQIIKQF